MGTNYYAVAPGNKHIHLGKSSHGWKFLAKAEPEWIRDESLRIWIERVITAPRIVDEYSDIISKAEFLAFVFGKQGETTSHTEYIAEHYPNLLDYWDCNGVNFTSGEFS